MVISIGEILVDLFGKQAEDGISYNRKAGGAPFNVACAAKKAGYKSGFTGRVGDDLFGKFLAEYAKNIGLDYLDVALDENFNTTLAIVQLDDAGERSFCFYRKRTADYTISDEQVKNAVKRANITHLGTLMLSEERGREVADLTVETVKKSGGRLSLDVNYRDDIFKGTDAVSVYKKYVEAADIVKFSEEELDMFAKGRTFDEKIRSVAEGKLVCVTLGKNGSAYCVNGRAGRAETISVKPVDTTGAGDAFFGCLLGALDGKDPFAMTDAELNEVFRRANVCGALTTTGFGAIDAIPCKSVIDGYLG
ncbi:MAG: carbohydrate kinase [Clostridia bacterium]|nr:carbohydrate kinase [Clostridia bacterium]